MLCRILGRLGFLPDGLFSLLDRSGTGFFCLVSLFCPLNKLLEAGLKNFKPARLASINDSQLLLNVANLAKQGNLLLNKLGVSLAANRAFLASSNQ